MFEPNTTDFDKSVVVEMDLNVWNLSFGGIFLIKIGLGFLFQATETLFMSGFCHTFVAFYSIRRVRGSVLVIDTILTISLPEYVFFPNQKVRA